MTVTVVCFGVMKEYLPDPNRNSARVQLRDEATVRDLLEEMRAPLSLLHMCLIDGRRAEPDEVLREEVEVTLMPPFSGGSPS